MMDIEKLIEHLHIAGAGNPGNIFDVAANAISTLQVENQALRNVAHGFKAENEKLRAGLDQVEAEKAKAIETLSENLRVAYQCRDAAVEDLETIMFVGGQNTDTCMYCENTQCYGRGGSQLCNPQWRGPEKEN